MPRSWKPRNSAVARDRNTATEAPAASRMARADRAVPVAMASARATPFRCSSKIRELTKIP
jgi:hypothetical protein